MFDVCVVGPVVWDRNSYGDLERGPVPGGVAYYASMTYRRLGLNTAVITKVAAVDERELLGDLRSIGVKVVNLPTQTTTVFKNYYAPDNADVRIQRVGSLADTIKLSEMPEIRTKAVHFGPLTPEDIEPEVMARCFPTGTTIALDAQGLTREIVDGKVMAKESVNYGDYLRSVDVLKLDRQEFLIFSGSPSLSEGVERVLAEGVHDLIVTDGSLGSIIHGNGDSFFIDAVPPRRVVDATGCGDTYLAAYMTKRMTSEDLEECGEFAAAAASLNLENFGPFKGTGKDVAEILQAMEGENPSDARAIDQYPYGLIHDE